MIPPSSPTSPYALVGTAIERLAGQETDPWQRSLAMAAVLVILYLASRGPGVESSSEVTVA